MPPTTSERRTIPRLALPDDAKRDWLRECAGLVYPDPRELAAWRAFVEASVHLAQRFLPMEMAKTLGDFFSAQGPDALVLENLPVDPQLPPAPADGRRPRSKSAVSES